MLRYLFLPLLFLLSASASYAEDLTITGKVVDNAGKPIENVDVAAFWGFDQERTQPFDGAKTDKEGNFSVKVAYWGRQASVMAIDAQRKHAGLIMVDKKSVGQPMTIKLEPAIHVFGEFASKDLGRNPGWTNVYVMTTDGARLLQCMSNQAKFSFLLPPGKYKFNGYGGDIRNHNQTLELSADKTELDLKTIDVPATVIAMHRGKTPPAWKVTDARGLNKEVTLDDFKGKWVLIEFWGFW